MAPQPKLTDELIEEICAAKRANPALTNKDLAAQFNLNRHTIGSALLHMSKDAPVVPAPQSTAASDITLISFDQLRESSLNYRRKFDPEKLAELSESIAVKGVMQNLVVRPLETEPGHYQIVAGARRFRAVSALVAAGRWNDEPINCRVINTDDAGHIAYAILENLQREDPSPLEEADAILALQESNPEFWTAKEIAHTIGKTPRYVYQRIALAKKLTPAAKEALNQGKLTVEAARLLSAQEPQVQEHLLGEWDENGLEVISAQDVIWEVRQYYIPVSRAIFEVDPNEVSIWTNNDTSFFEIPSEFWERQLAAVETQRVALATKWPWVLVSLPKARLSKQFVEDQAAPIAQKGALIIVEDSGTVEILEHVVEEPITEDAMPDADDDGETQQVSAPLKHPVPEIPTPEPNQKSAVTKSHIYHAHQRKTKALRAAVVADPLLAIRCACFGMLCTGNNVVHLHKNDRGLLCEDRARYTLEHESIITRLLGKTKPPQYSNDIKAELAVFKRICALEVDDLYTLHAALVAQTVGTYAMHDCALGDNAIAVAVATEAGLCGNEDKHGLTVTREDLNGVRKPTLLAMADAAGTPALNDEMNTGDILNAIASKSTAYVLPTLRFATSAQIEKALMFK